MALECNKWAGLYLMSLFNTYELGNSYLLHIPHTNDTKMFKSPGLTKIIMRNCPGPCEGSGWPKQTTQALRQHVSVNVPAWWRCTICCTMSLRWITKWYSKIQQQEVLPWWWWLPGCRKLNPTFDPLKNWQNCKSGGLELLTVCGAAQHPHTSVILLTHSQNHHNSWSTKTQIPVILKFLTNATKEHA